MRALLVAGLLVLFWGPWAGRAQGEEPGSALRVGGGPLYSTLRQGIPVGRAFMLGAAKPLRPWFQLGIEAAWLRVDGRTVSHDYGFYSYRTEPSDEVIVAATFRMQGPVDVGPAPFVEASHGGSLAPAGGASDLKWYSSVGIGLRFVVPAPWPDAEVCLRRHFWDDPDHRTLVEPRFALAF